MKVFYKSIKKYFNKKSSSILSQFMGDNKVCLMDVGAAGGLEPRWEPYQKNLKVIGFEPDGRTSSEIEINQADVGSLVINKAVWSTDSMITINHTKKPLCSSVYKPNLEYLKIFPDVERYGVEFESEYHAVTISKICQELSLKPDFIKIDIQGGELEVLKGAGDTLDLVLGIESEVEFKPFYLDQPLFPEILQFMENKDFTMIDFIGLGRMERNQFRGIGECNFGDALFLRTPEYILEKFKAGLIDESVLARYCAILYIYHRYDLLLTVYEALKSANLAESITNNLLGLIDDAKRKTNLICSVSKYSSYLINLFGISNRVNVLY